MTRQQAEQECERRRQLVESRALLQFSAWFAARRMTFPDVLRRALVDCSRESCRVGDLCAFERAGAGAAWDDEITPHVVTDVPERARR